MSTQVTQIKIALPDPLFGYVQSKAGKFGITLSSYIKNLILNDVKDMEYPTFVASDATVAAYNQAQKERKKAVKVDDIDAFFAQL